MLLSFIRGGSLLESGCYTILQKPGERHYMTNKTAYLSFFLVNIFCFKSPEKEDMIK